MQRKSRSLQVVELRSSCNHESAKHLAVHEILQCQGMSIACVQKTVVENSYCSVNCAVPPLIDLQQAVKPLWGPIPLLPATWRIALQQRNAHGNYSGTTTLIAAVSDQGIDWKIGAAIFAKVWSLCWVTQTSVQKAGRKMLIPSTSSQDQVQIQKESWIYFCAMEMNRREWNQSCQAGNLKARPLPDLQLEYTPVLGRAIARPSIT